MTEKEHTFAEALQHLAAGHEIDFDVRIEGHHGALMTRQEWLDDVAAGGFIDYDGWGNQVNAAGAIVGPTISPSRADTLRDDCAYILWYNR